MKAILCAHTVPEEILKVDLYVILRLRLKEMAELGVLRHKQGL